MIGCRLSTVQNYECQVMVELNKPYLADKLYPKTKIAFDACLAKELFFLWDLGIVTNGCCCGKHIDSKPEQKAFIGVHPEFASQMKAMGYKELSMAKNHFKPKTEL